MLQILPHRILRGSAFLLVAVILTGTVIADDPSKETGSSLSPLLGKLSPDTAGSGIQFFTKKTRLWLGRSQVICFYAKKPVDQNRYLSFGADENYLHVLIPPTLVPGTHIGYIRVRPLKEGTTRLTLQGNAMDVDIAKDTASITTETTKPEITTPAEGAVVWDKFAVGVDRLNFATTPPDSLPVLRLPDGSEIKPRELPKQPGPHLHYAYTVDAKSLHPGSNELYAVIRGKSGREIISDPVSVVAWEPAHQEIAAGQCKDQIQTHPLPPKVPPPGPPKPFVPPKVEADKKALYGMIVSNPTDNSPWCMPVNVPAKGLYQMIVTAAGDLGGNALPTMALTVDNEQNTSTSSRLATTDWQRVPVGHPMTLTEGFHVLSIRFRNAFGGQPEDSRHLYLARYELARLDQLPPVDAAADPSKMMMQGAPVTSNDQKMQPSPTSTEQHSGAAMMQGSMMMETMKSGIPINSGNFHLAFQDPLDGQTISSQVTVNARAWWTDQQHSPPPTVELIINGKVAASITSPQPHFPVDVSAFSPGINSIQLRGVLPGGQRTQSITESLILPRGLSTGVPYHPRHTYFVHDPAWEGSLNGRINPKDTDPVASFENHGEATLKLPDSLEGFYKISLEARGTSANGPVVADLLLKTTGGETKLGEVAVKPALASLDVAQNNFSPGPKELILRFAENTPALEKGNPRLVVRALRMEPLVKQPAKIPVLASIAYPPANARIGMADAVVANVSGAGGVVQADLLIDGEPQHFNLTPANGLGPILFPLLTRQLTPGHHQLQIAARDAFGNKATSTPVGIDVSKDAQEDAQKDAQGNAKTTANGTYARAVFLLSRFGYGPEPRELAAILTMGPEEWLRSRITEPTDSPSERNEQKYLRSEFPNFDAPVPRAMELLITDPNPVRTRFLVWIENHFSTWVNKDGGGEKSREHERFRELGIAPFQDLLLASATSPAMIIYLDQRYSVARRLNENYAREIMELHTLGVKGGYTQKDVTSLADLLTGWSLADEASIEGSQNLERTFRYDPYLNSDSPEVILGMEFPGVPLEDRFDRVLTALNMLSAHPSCALFISRKLAEHYLSDPAPPDVVNDLARIYMESGGDMRQMLIALSERPEFWSAPPRVASPIDFGVRLARISGLRNPAPVNDLAARSGMGLFDRATPDGYPDTDGYFVSSNSLLQRWHFAQAIQESFLGNKLIPDEWKPADHAWDPATTQRLLDLAAVRITGNVLTPASNASALQLIASTPPNTENRMHLLTTFVCQTPETTLK